MLSADVLITPVLVIYFYLPTSDQGFVGCKQSVTLCHEEFFFFSKIETQLQGLHVYTKQVNKIEK